ncbi:Methyltransferase TRM13 family protein [Leishmania donovani]|uniref:tRNA:m(4)X modification enzyme TRM13 n=1 Tax=Leishmania donovani TaxID=5661 RepID=A0A504XU88_LEIDO|nr:Methyltransferase TRM13 family protein [Leishmania donovani]
MWRPCKRLRRCSAYVAAPSTAAAAALGTPQRHCAETTGKAQYASNSEHHGLAASATLPTATALRRRKLRCLRGAYHASRAVAQLLLPLLQPARSILGYMDMTDAMKNLATALEGSPVSLEHEGPLQDAHLIAIRDLATSATVTDLRSRLLNGSLCPRGATSLTAALWNKTSVRDYQKCLLAARQARLDAGHSFNGYDHLAEAGAAMRSAMCSDVAEPKTCAEWARLIDLYTSFLPDRSHIHELENLPQEIAIGELLRETRLQCDSVVIDPFFPAHSIDCCPRLGVDEVLRHLEAQESLPRILVLAPCCFNKITVDRYCDAAYLRQVMGIGSEEALARVNRLTDWNMSCYQSTHERMLARVEAARRSSATSGRGCACEVQIAMEASASQALPAVDGSSAATAPLFCYQRRSGPRSIANSITCTHDFALLVEALLNYGRMQWLQQRHYDVHLVQYVPDNYRCKQRQYHSVLWSLQFVLALLHHARKGAARARQQQHERGNAREDNSCCCSTSTGAADTESDTLIAFQAAADGALASFATQGPLSASQLLSLQNSLTDADVRDLCVQCMRHFITQQQQPAPTLTSVQQPLFSAENVFAAPTPLLLVLWPTESVRQHYTWALEVAHHHRIDHSDLLAIPGYLQEAGLHARRVFAGYSGAKHDERSTVAQDSEQRAAHEWARLIDLYTSFLPDRSHIHELENLPQEIAIGELLRETRLQCDSVVIDPFFPAHSIDCCPRLGVDEVLRHLEAQESLPRILVLAPCCFSKCSLDTYIDPDFVSALLGLGSAAAFCHLTRLTDWNVSVHQRLQGVALSGRGPSASVSKKSVRYFVSCPEGIAASVEAVVSQGRVQWLQRHGYIVRLVEYVPDCVTPKNRCMVAYRT